MEGGNLYTKLGAGFGSSNITSNTYFGLLEGKSDTNVFNFAFELYLSADPVFPATSYPSTSAKFAVPSSRLTTFLSIKFIASLVLSEIILSLFSIVFFSFIKIDGLILYPPLPKIA